MADPQRGEGKPPEHIHIEDAKKTNWLPWLLLLLGLLALIWWLVNRSRDEAAVTTTTTTTATTAAPAAALPADTSVTGAATTTSATTATTTAPAGVGTLGTYLAGTEAVPRTFVFERLNFDTNSAAVRPQDQDELNTAVQAMRQYPNARVRVVGFADPRGGADYNAQLGQQRADSVKAAMVQSGIAADRIETASGGENAPVATNATAGGMAENRRTELVLLTR